MSLKRKSPECGLIHENTINNLAVKRFRGTCLNYRGIIQWNICDTQHCSDAITPGWTHIYPKGITKLKQGEPKPTIMEEKDGWTFFLLSLQNWDIREGHANLLLFHKKGENTICYLIETNEGEHKELLEKTYKKRKFIMAFDYITDNTIISPIYLGARTTTPEGEGLCLTVVADFADKVCKELGNQEFDLELFISRYGNSGEVLFDEEIRKVNDIILHEQLEMKKKMGTWGIFPGGGKRKSKSKRKSKFIKKSKRLTKRRKNFKRKSSRKRKSKRNKVKH